MKTQAFASSSDPRAAMRQAGVVDKPDICFLSSLPEEERFSGVCQQVGWGSGQVVTRPAT
jgi:lipopolysaccharide biosynthesis protein